MAVAERILRRARNLKGLEVFRMFPDEVHALQVKLGDGEYTIYRDGDILTQVDSRGKEREIGMRSFIDRYVPKARPRTK